MGLGRKISRQIDKNRLQGAAEKLDALSGQLPALLPHLNQVRTVVAYALEEQEALKYETMRSRAVQLRFIYQDFTEPGVEYNEETLTQRLLDVEEQYRCEYDAVVAIARLAQFAGKAQEIAAHP